MNLGSNNNLIQTSFKTTENHKVLRTNHEKKGFSSQAKRFPSHVAVVGPGPGSYDSVLSEAVSPSPSFSKRGTSGFISSQVARGYRDPARRLPGPDCYNVQRSVVRRSDFSSGPSRVFRPPVAVRLHTAPSPAPSPAPNQYDLRCRGDRNRICFVAGTSSFVSKTSRDSFNTNTNVPSPCHYSVNHLSIQRSSNVVLSPFKSKTSRVPVAVDNHIPGPGAYSPHQAAPPAPRTLLPWRGFYLARAAPPLIGCKAPPLIGSRDRPLIGCKDRPSPGPGHYDVGSQDGSKRPVPSAAFASTTKRSVQHQDHHTPGPGFYDPLVSSKQSFLYSDVRVWIPG